MTDDEFESAKGSAAALSEFSNDRFPDCAHIDEIKSALDSSTDPLKAYLLAYYTMIQYLMHNQK